MKDNLLRIRLARMKAQSGDHGFDNCFPALLVETRLISCLMRRVYCASTIVNA